MAAALLWLVFPGSLFGSSVFLVLKVVICVKR